MTDQEKLEKINEVIHNFWDRHSECHDSEVEDLAIEALTTIGKTVRGDEE